MHMTLEDLLVKLGVPEVLESGTQRWHYTDEKDPDVGGFAEVRLEAKGKQLVAELKHWRKNMLTEDGVCEPMLQTAHLRATRVGDTDRFSVTEAGFDGSVYRPCPRPMLELTCAIFHARAIDINTRMVNAAFRAEADAMDHVREEILAGEMPAPRRSARRSTDGIVIPFQAARERRISA